MRRQIDISAIPELETSVGMHGSMKQAETIGAAGPLIAALLVALIIGL